MAYNSEIKCGKWIYNENLSSRKCSDVGWYCSYCGIQNHDMMKFSNLKPNEFPSRCPNCNAEMNFTPYDPYDW